MKKYKEEKRIENGKEYTVKVFKDKTEYYFNGQLHREDGPAIEYINGYKEWCINGQRHCEDGPAVEFNNGHKEWWFNGKRHREDGPAIEYNRYKQWFIDGRQLSEEEWLKKYKEEKRNNKKLTEEEFNNKYISNRNDCC